MYYKIAKSHTDIASVVISRVNKQPNNIVVGILTMFWFLPQLLESIAQLQTERDRYAQQIQEEGRLWKDKTEQLLTQVNTWSQQRLQHIGE